MTNIRDCTLYVLTAVSPLRLSYYILLVIIYANIKKKLIASYSSSIYFINVCI